MTEYETASLIAQYVGVAHRACTMRPDLGGHPSDAPAPPRAGTAASTRNAAPTTSATPKPSRIMPRPCARSIALIERTAPKPGAP